MSELKSWSERSELEQLSCEYWDFYKSAYGVRPRGVDTSDWTVEDFQREFVALGEVCRRNQEQRQAAQERAANDLEIRIQGLLMSGAVDRAMAVRWIDEAEGADGDRDYLCYLLGVEYGYFDK